MATRPRRLDSQIEIVTPENIAFEYRVAGPFLRMPAYLIDLVIRVGVFLVVLLGLGFAFGIAGLGFLGVTVSILLLFVLEWFYGGLLETFWNGQTIGKRIFHLRVVSVDGQPINAMQAILRNLLRAVDMMPVFPLGGVPVPCFLVGLITCAVSGRSQRLGDLACGTLVIVEERRHMRGLLRVGGTDVALVAQQIPASFVASRTLAKAVSNYVERRGKFAAQRRAEIARYVAVPLIEKFNLPVQTNHDVFLCALYRRIFMAPESQAMEPQSPPVMPWTGAGEPPVQQAPQIQTALDIR